VERGVAYAAKKLYAKARTSMITRSISIRVARYPPPPGGNCSTEGRRGRRTLCIRKEARQARKKARGSASRTGGHSTIRPPEGRQNGSLNDRSLTTHGSIGGSEDLSVRRKTCSQPDRRLRATGRHGQRRRSRIESRQNKKNFLKNDWLVR